MFLPRERKFKNVVHRNARMCVLTIRRKVSKLLGSITVLVIVAPSSTFASVRRSTQRVGHAKMCMSHGAASVDAWQLHQIVAPYSIMPSWPLTSSGNVVADQIVAGYEVAGRRRLVST